jgi:hypothetical protein
VQKPGRRMLSTRRLTDKKVPPLMHGMAFRNVRIDRGIARRMLPPNSVRIVIGQRTLWYGVNGGTCP